MGLFVDKLSIHRYSVYHGAQGQNGPNPEYRVGKTMKPAQRPSIWAIVELAVVAESQYHTTAMI